MEVVIFNREDISTNLPDQRYFPLLCGLFLEVNPTATIDNIKEILKSEGFFAESIMKGMQPNIRGIFCRKFNSPQGDNVIKKMFPNPEHKNLLKQNLDINSVKKKLYSLWKTSREDVLLMTNEEKADISCKISHYGRVLKKLTSNLFGDSFTTTEIENSYQGLLVNLKLSLELTNSCSGLSESVNENRIRRYLKLYNDTTREGGKHPETVPKQILEKLYLQRFFLRESTDDNTFNVTKTIDEEFQILKEDIIQLKNDEKKYENEKQDLFGTSTSTDFQNNNLESDSNSSTSYDGEEDVDVLMKEETFENIEFPEIEKEYDGHDDDSLLVKSMSQVEEECEQKIEFELRKINIDVPRMTVVTAEKDKIKIFNESNTKNLELIIYKATKRVSLQFKYQIKNSENENEFKNFKQDIKVDDIKFVTLVEDKSKLERLNEIVYDNCDPENEELKIEGPVMCFELLDTQIIKMKDKKWHECNDPTNHLRNSVTYIIKIDEKYYDELKWRFKNVTKLYINDLCFQFEFDINEKISRSKKLSYKKFRVLDPEIQEEVNQTHEFIMKNILPYGSIDDLQCCVCKEKNIPVGGHSVCWKSIDAEENCCGTKVHEILKSVIQKGVQIRPKIENEIIKNIKN